jgi:NADH-quinone oxidoreductase subunit L
VAEDFFIQSHHSVPSFILQVPVIASLLGIAAAYFFFFSKPHLAFNLSRYGKYLYIFFLNKWFFDKIYSKIFVQGALILGNFLWQRGDISVIDRFGPNGISHLTARLSGALKSCQTGYVYHYAFAMMLGLVGMLFYLLIQGGME